MMEAARTSETLVNFTRLHGATTQKTAIFLLTAVRTSNPTKEVLTIILWRRHGNYLTSSRKETSVSYDMETLWKGHQIRRGSNSSDVTVVRNVIQNKELERRSYIPVICWC
jgi:hypothetical protein